MPLNDAHLGGFFFLGFMKYTKPPLTYDQQIALLQSRGLTIADPIHATRYLERISYYRLSAYALPFQATKDTFNDGTSFSDLLHLYAFDRELRLLIMDAIERLEVAVRAQMIYQLAHRYGSHWVDEKGIFKPPYTDKSGKVVDVYQETQTLIQDQLAAKSPEVFIKHYRSIYNDPVNPPSWMSVELLTIGQLSRMFSALKENEDRRGIAEFFGLHHHVLVSWLHALTYVRNICAHHSRLWNRAFAVKPDLLLRPNRPWITADMRDNNDRCYYFLCTLKYLLDAANPGNHLRAGLEKLMDDNPKIPIQFMGIPSKPDGGLIHWQTEPLWA